MVTYGDYLEIVVFVLFELGIESGDICRMDFPFRFPPRPRTIGRCRQSMQSMGKAVGMLKEAHTKANAQDAQ
jgi:hypothetical protein